MIRDHTKKKKTIFEPSICQVSKIMHYNLGRAVDLCPAVSLCAYVFTRILREAYKLLQNFLFFFFLNITES